MHKTFPRKTHRTRYTDAMKATGSREACLRLSWTYDGSAASVQRALIELATGPNWACVLPETDPYRSDKGVHSA